MKIFVRHLTVKLVLAAKIVNQKHGKCYQKLFLKSLSTQN